MSFRNTSTMGQDALAFHESRQQSVAESRVAISKMLGEEPDCLFVTEMRHVCKRCGLQGLHTLSKTS